MKEKNNLVYSTEEKGKNLRKESAKKRQNLEKENVEEITPESTTLKLQYEKKGRGGKGVSLVMELPHNPPYFKRLMKEIKAKLATGGAYKEKPTPQLEFQGQHLDQIREFLQEKGFIVKG